MNFKQAQQAYAVLKRQYEYHNISDEEFQKQCDKLTVTDSKGILWQIGVKSGHWYRLSGENWVEDQPPMDAPTLSMRAPVSMPPRPQHESLIMQAPQMPLPSPAPYTSSASVPITPYPYTAGAPLPVAPAPRKKFPVWLIVVIVLVVLCCCLITLWLLGSFILDVLNSTYNSYGHINPADFIAMLVSCA